LRRSRRLLAVGLTAALGACSVASAGSRSAVVPAGGYLAGDVAGNLVALDGSGKVVRRLAPFGEVSVQGIGLAHDRRHAFVSFADAASPATLDEIDLATGAKRTLANAVSPALSPDGARLAYTTIETRGTSPTEPRSSCGSCEPARCGASPSPPTSHSEPRPSSCSTGRRTAAASSW
jgi:hypothetical protein